MGFHIYEMPRTGKPTEIESRWVVFRGWGKTMQSDCLIGRRFPFGLMRKI